MAGLESPKCMFLAKEITFRDQGKDRKSGIHMLQRGRKSGVLQSGRKSGMHTHGRKSGMHMPQSEMKMLQSGRKSAHAPEQEEVRYAHAHSTRAGGSQVPER